jgi:hypothetical protein
MPITPLKSASRRPSSEWRVTAASKQRRAVQTTLSSSAKGLADGTLKPALLTYSDSEAAVSEMSNAKGLISLNSRTKASFVSCPPNMSPALSPSRSVGAFG